MLKKKALIVGGKVVAGGAASGGGEVGIVISVAMFIWAIVDIVNIVIYLIQ